MRAGYGADDRWSAEAPADDTRRPAPGRTPPLATVTRRTRATAALVAAVCAVATLDLRWPTQGPSTPLAAATAAQPGLTAVGEILDAYDAVLDADFERMPAVLADTCGPAPPAACLGLQALATWWDIQLDPENRALDPRLIAETERAITNATDWTRREAGRAEAWFYLGVALGTRAQWRVLREERLAAARDGKRIRDALERALAIDPDMHDAEFGIGVYRYYAAVAPAVVRWLRWLFLLPGGNRAGGLAQMEAARREGRLVADEAAYQLHAAYLWYEDRVPEALALIIGLEARHPHNPLFAQIEARIRDVYLHDHAGSLAVSERLLDAARAGRVNRPALASVRARLDMAIELDHLGERDRARDRIDALLAESPQVPVDAVRRARQLQRAWMPR